MRVRVNPYGASNSAKELSRYLGVKRLLSNGSSRFIGKHRDVVINWGNGKGNVGIARQINKLSNVQLASNKLSTFIALDRAGVSIPWFSTNKSEAEDSLYTIISRTNLYGHSGDGIVAGVVNAPLYVEYINKVAEYRAIVVGNEVVDFKQKKKKREVAHHPTVWNLSGGYIMAREGIAKPDGIDVLAIVAVQALGLDFGAVDIIADGDGVLYVLEVNTAFGLEGTTIQLVGDAIRRML
jgi:glutathione synthase/RimK-type ligase-like ATP-grasp enzyme